MPRPPSKLARVRQIYNWLVDTHPTPYPTKLILDTFSEDLETRKLQGFCYRDGNRLYVLVNPKMPLYVMADALFHEYAHAMVWQQPKVEAFRRSHSSYWGVALADLEHSYHDDGGAAASKDYPWT